MRRVLLVQPSLQPPGGGNGVAAWMLQALCEVQRVTVLSSTPVDVEPINRFFGTSLRPSHFDRIVLPQTWIRLLDVAPMPLALVARKLRRVRAMTSRGSGSEFMPSKRIQPRMTRIARMSLSASSA